MQAKSIIFVNRFKLCLLSTEVFENHRIRSLLHNLCQSFNFKKCLSLIFTRTISILSIKVFSLFKIKDKFRSIHKFWLLL